MSSSPFSGDIPVPAQKLHPDYGHREFEVKVPTTRLAALQDGQQSENPLPETGVQG